MTAAVTWANPANGQYSVDVEEIEDYEWEEAPEDGSYPVLDTMFSIEEIEFLERDAGGYIEEMKKASWWPEVADERAAALAEQRRSEAGDENDENSESDTNQGKSRDPEVG